MARSLRETPHHALSKAFRDHVVNHGGWPLENALFKWMETHYGGTKHDEYTKLKAGKLVAEKYVVGLLGMRAAESESASSECSRFGEVIRGYLSHNSVRDPRNVTDKDAVALTCEPSHDWIAAGFARLHAAMTWLHDALKGTLSLEKIVRPCGTEAEVREAVRFMYDDCGCGLLREPDAAPERAEAKAVVAIGLSLEVYETHAVAWARREPWSVVRSWGDCKPNGMSIVLGLSDAGYAALRNGDRRPHQLVDEHFATPSRRLFIEAAAVRRPKVGGETGDPSLALLIAHLSQAAWLSRQPAPGQASALRVLTFEGTDLNCARLRSYGYKRVDGTYGSTERRLMKLELPCDRGGVMQNLKDSILEGPLNALRSRIRRNKVLASPEPLSPS